SLHRRSLSRVHTCARTPDDAVPPCLSWKPKTAYNSYIGLTRSVLLSMCRSSEALPDDGRITAQSPPSYNIFGSVKSALRNVLRLGDMHDRPVVHIGFSFAQHFSGDRCDRALPQDQVAQNFVRR